MQTLESPLTCQTTKIGGEDQHKKVEKTNVKQEKKRMEKTQKRLYIVLLSLVHYKLINTIPHNNSIKSAKPTKE